jgi:hypothetical protein
LTAAAAGAQTVTLLPAEPPGLAVRVQAGTSERAGGPVKIAFLGDSLTLGAEAGRWWDDDRLTWRGRVRDGLQSRFPGARIQEVAAYRGGEGVDYATFTNAPWAKSSHPRGRRASKCSCSRDGVVRFLERYGPGGAFFRENPGVRETPVIQVELWNEPNFQYMIPDDRNRPRVELETERENLYARLDLDAFRAGDFDGDGQRDIPALPPCLENP